jgi:hypothetical protein
MSDKETRDYWSECEQILFHYGKGYGLAETLETVCLGKEEDILKALETGELPDCLTPKERKALAWVIEYRKEQGIGTTDTSGADMERAVNNGATRHKPKTARLLTPRKRLPLRSPRAKGKSLSGK